MYSYHKKDRIYWLCVCDCGNLKEVNGHDLKCGKIKSCGCLYKTSHTIHGKSHTAIYRAWQSMKSRCYNINNPCYKRYGGRGISMCDKWKNDFKAFYDWAISNVYKKGLQIDRIDVNGNYEPDNCRWVTPKKNSNNKRNNLYITIDDIQKTLYEWCDFYNLNYQTVWRRIHRGWSIKKALELEA